MEDIKDIIENFDFKGELIEYRIWGSGHINNTYLVTYNDKGKLNKYIVQKVNSNVFKNMEGLMNNIFNVTSYLKEQIKKCGGDVNKETLQYIKTKNGNVYYKSSEGDCYRASVFVSNSISYDKATNAELFLESGIAFGRFQRLLDEFPVETLCETISNFHNTKKRYENEFLPAVEEDLYSRVNECKKEIDFIIQRKEYCSRIIDLIEKEEIPVRVTHNDSKLNNVMFDVNTNKATCVVDLDTVMPGSALYDFGDSIRFGANKADEDENDLSKVGINLEYFEAYAKGFLQETKDILNKTEIDNLVFSSLLMTFECGMRFLTDYLNGDIYFKIEYPQHNLIRARNQLALVENMEKHMNEMKDIIKKLL